MSVLLTDLRDVGLGVASRVRSGAATLRRTSPTVLLLRVLIAGALVAAWTMTVPTRLLLSPWALLAMLVPALAAALFPRTRAVGFALVTTAGAWLGLTMSSAASPSLGRVLGLAAALYVAHTAAALAAVLPHDTAVDPPALGRWALRTTLVLATSLRLGAAGLTVADALPRDQSLVGPLVGSVVAAGIVGLIAWLVRRRA